MDQINGETMVTEMLDSFDDVTLRTKEQPNLSAQQRAGGNKRRPWTSKLNAYLVTCLRTTLLKPAFCFPFALSSSS